MESVCTAESSVVNNGSMEIKEDDDDDKEEEKEKQDVFGSETKVLVNKKSWEPSVLATIGKEIHHFAGHDISIWESLDSYGSVIWPAALALCHYLESNHDTVNLLDKAVLEIGAGTGLVSIVASLLGAWVTATDLPEVLSNLRCNLSRNTRGHCRYTPQVAELSWGYGLDKSFPHSVYRYDYVLAADVVYHHDFLAELLVTMRHFCQPGTTLIWANKVRFESDLVFTENFKKAFNTTLLEDNGEVKIYAATTKEGGGPVVSEVMKEAVREEEGEAEMIVETEMKSEELKEQKMVEHEEVRGQKEFVEVFEDDGKQNVERNSQFREDLVTRHTDMGKQVEASKVEEGNLNDNKDEHKDNRSCETEESENEESCSDRDSADETFIKQNEECSTETNKQDFMRLWAPTIYYRPTKEIYYFLDQEIKIQESIDYYGALIWPAGVAACRFLETPQGRQQFNFLDKSVLELGAGTGLLSVVVTLLGAKLTTTDLPEILSNLTCNINRNTRGRRRHEPLITELLWGHKLEETFPKFTHYYDYVLATDVVYHHDYLAELLATMNYFCQPGTTLVWANKVRSASDLVFIEDFHRTFNTTLLTVIDDVRIYVATTKLSEEEAYLVTEMSEEEEVEERVKVEEHDKHVVEDDAPDFGEYIKHDQDYQDLEQNAGETSPVGEKGEGSNPDEKNIIVEATLVELECDQTQSSETDSEEKQAHEGVQDCEVSQQEDEEILAEPDNTGTNEHSVYQRSWAPTVYYKLCKEIYNFVGHEITIQESIDSYGGMIWPGALALCRFLETPAGQQQINLLDKSTLEIGAGTGLVSIVATLLGAKLTATDLPEVLGNLRCNLNRNTRWHRRHEPQVEALSWGHRLEETFPQSSHHYDYILAADVVYHHDFLAELLTTMCHFCQTGTTLIWANKVRYASDLVFIENFKKAFDTTLLTELDEVRIYSATMRESEDDNAQEDDQEKRVEEPDPLSSDKQSKPNRKLERREGSLGRTVVQDPVRTIKESDDEGDHTSDEKNLWNHHKRTKDGRENKGNDIQTRDQNDGNYTAKVRNEAIKELDEENANDELTSSDNKGNVPTKSDNTKTVMLAQQESTEPKMNTKLCSERYFFAGHEIVITDTLEPYRLKERPAALALCKFLEADPLPLSFKSKAVLELGAGSGLVSIVASLLGAWVTATDKPAVIDNLSSNLFRNTKGRSKHKPQVEALFWNKNLKQTFPRSIYHYDIVLAADVVYQHNYLDDLLATMRHFCQPGTTLIWANRMCSQTDVNFTQRFKKAFQSTLLAEMEEVKIFMAVPHIQQFV